MSLVDPCTAALVRKGVFDVYLGLTASGYDLADTKDVDVASLVCTVQGAPWSADIVSYFRRSRNLQGNTSVNPYWPGAYFLLMAALGLSSTLGAEPSLAPYLGGETNMWISGLPHMLDALERHPQHKAFRSQYDRVVELLTGEVRVRGAVGRAKEAISRVLGGDSTDGLNIELVINPLQSQFLTDYIELDGSLFVICSKPRESSIMHEALHRVFRPMLQSARELILSHRHLLLPVLDRMRYLQYCTDDGQEGWYRVFEESLVRAGTAWVLGSTCGSGSALNEVAVSSVEHEREIGFRYVPTLLDCLEDCWTRTGNSEIFVRECLARCEASSTRQQP